MKSKTETLTKIVLLGLVVLMTACSQKNDETSTDSASRGVVDSTNDANAAKLAYCNQGANSDFTIKLQAYVNGTTNQVNMNYAVLRLASAPSTFVGGTSHFALWKWLANTSNAVTFDQTALRFYAYDNQTGSQLTGWMTTLRWSDISTYYTTWGSTSLSTFLARINIVVELNDPSAAYDVLELAHYTTSTGALISQLDILLPMFAANPNEYAIDTTGGTRAARLQALHPFKLQASQNLTSAQYQAMAQTYCF
jgi:hypothetical protein